MFKIHHNQQPINNFYKPKIEKNAIKNIQINSQKDIVTISEEAQVNYFKSLKFKEANTEDVLGKQFKKFYEEYNSAEAIEKRRLDLMEKEQAYNRLEDKFSQSVQYEFPKNTLQHTIKEALEGKVVNASLYAAELASALRSSVSMPDKSVEERAAYREIALNQAQYIAENYFSDEQEAASFMNEITKYYENDILREKGYIVIDNSDLQPFKKFSSPLSNNGDVSFYTLAKRYMDEDYFEHLINGEGKPEDSTKFLMQLKNNQDKYRKEIIGEYAANEQNIEKQITATKSMLAKFTWENGLVTETSEDLPSFMVEILKWNHNMLNLFN